MGLDAYVMCRCWEEGLCHPPASLASRLSFDPETGVIDHTTPEDASAEEYLALSREFDVWISEKACAHQDMNSAAERIANWSMLRDFQYALHSLGEASYVTLLREIPDYNGGITKPAVARICLTELDRFCAEGAFGRVVELVDRNTSKVIYSKVDPYGGWWSGDGSTGICTRMTMDGMFQIDRSHLSLTLQDPDAEILFRSNSFSVENIGTGLSRLTDLLSGKQLTCWSVFQHVLEQSTAYFQVRQASDHPGRYAYCVEPLRRVFQAAVETGYPVLWT